jgi:hypothetical protein
MITMQRGPTTSSITAVLPNRLLLVVPGLMWLCRGHLLSSNRKAGPLRAAVSAEDSNHEADKDSTARPCVHG